MRKKLLVLCIVLACMCVMLAGCGIFDSKSDDSSGSSSQSGEPTPAYEYTAADIQYFTTAGELICTSSSGNTKRSYYKAYAGYCAVALANINGSFGPVLVGEDEVQVCFKQNYDNAIVGAGGSVVVNGKTYYYSKAEYFLSGSLDGTKKYSNYFSQFTTLEEVARDVASKATFVPVDDSLKVQYVYTEGTDETLTISAGPYLSAPNGRLEIPSEIGGKKVSAIAANGFAGLTSIKEVIIPKGVTKIGARAFEGCIKLHRAYVPATVTTIGTRAFANNASDMCLFCGVTSKPSDYYSTNSISQPSVLWNYGAMLTIYGTTRYGETEEYLYAELRDETIHYTLYKGDAENVVIPNTIEDKAVTVVGGWSFAGNETLKTITFPTGLKEIRSSAFASCTKLNNVIVPYGTTSIEARAFEGCIKLNRAYVPATVTTIGTRAFANNASDMYLFCGVTSKPSDYYSTNSISQPSVLWNYGAKKTLYRSSGWVDDGDFVYNIQFDSTQLTLVGYYLPENLTIELPSDGIITRDGVDYTIVNLGNSFQGNDQLKGINIPATVTQINANEFSGCTNLKFVFEMDGANIQTIGSYAFKNCYNLKSLVIPNVSNWGEGVFYGCTGLTELDFNGTKSEWNTLALSGNLVTAIFNILLDKNWDKGCSLTRVNCSDGYVEK